MANKRSTTKEDYSDDDDSYTSYSDEFEHVSRSPTPDDKRRYKTRNKQKSYTGALESESSSTTFTASSYSPKKSTQSEHRRRTYKATPLATKKGWMSSSYSKSARRKPAVSKPDHIHARMLSAQKSRINNLTDELGETETKMEQLEKENRYLKNLQHRQDKALRKFEDKEGELPKLINQHMDDERVLRARLRKVQESERRLEARLRDRADEVQKMEHTLRKLKKIIYDKNLGERSELAKKLNTAEDKLYEAERKNKDLEKKVELTTQSFQRQMNGERAKHRETKQKLQILQDDYNTVQAKLKEKERALEVSNIYALRSKHSPEKSFIGKASVTSPRHHAEKPPSRETAVPPLALTSPRQPATKVGNFDPPESSLPADVEKPSPSVIEATSGVEDFRRTIKTPAKAFTEDKEDSSLLDFGSSSNAGVITNGLNEANQVAKSKNEKTGAENQASSSFFLTNAYGSPNPTFVSNGGPSSPKNRSPPDSLNRQLSPHGNVSFEKKKDEQELEEERKKVDEERRKKAELLARIKGIEEENNSSASGNKKSDDEDLRKLLDNKNTTSGKMASSENRVATKKEKGQDKKQQHREHSHQSASQGADLGKKSPDAMEPELTFGGYAPTVTSQPKRKPRAQQKKQQRHSPPGSESDEPLLDVASGKAKKSDLLQQLFGDQTAKQSSTVSNGPTKKEASLTSSQETSRMKTTPRAKPVHSGYPWERNVMPASQNGSIDGHLNRKNEILTGPVVKALPAFNDDDIEEVIL